MTTRTILCFGDSNTHGSCAMRTPDDRRRHAFALRWPNVMAAALGAAWEVVSEGHPGRTAVFDDPIEGSHKNGQAALPVLLESHRPLDLVIVMLGTNDLKARFDQSAHDIALGLRRIVRDILGSDSGPEGRAPQVLLAAPARARECGVLTETFAGATAKAAALPAYLAAVAAREAVPFADMSPVADVDPVDGVHLSVAAHAAIGAAMAEAVLQIFED